MLRIEWHPEAIEDLRKLGASDQRRIKKVVDSLADLEDPRPRLIPYSGNMKGFWKLRIGDLRLVCQVFERDGGLVLVISVAHRSVAYDRRNVRRFKSRTD